MRVRLFLLLVAALWIALFASDRPVSAQALLQKPVSSSEQAQSETTPATRGQVEAFKLELNQIEIGLERRQLNEAVLNARQDVRVLADVVQDGVGDQYSEAFLVRKDAGIKSVADLKGKRVGTAPSGA